MIKRLGLALAMLLLGTAPVLAADDGRIHFANVTGADVQLLIDDAAAIPVGKGLWKYQPAPSGTHRIRVRVSDGKTLEETWAFSRNELATFGAHSYWCLALLGNGGSDPYFLMKLDGDQCRQVLSAGPAIN